MADGAHPAPSPRRGEGWGEGGRRVSAASDLAFGHPQPTLSLKGEGLRARVEQGGAGLLQNALEVVNYVIVPEAHDNEAMRLDDVATFGVRLAFRMLAPVQFDRQARSPARKISHIRSDRKLTDELGTFDLPIAQVLPQHRFHVRRSSPQFTRNRCESLLHPRRSPLANPLPGL